MYYLSELARQAGHETFFLTCDADLPRCYTRELRNRRSDWQECLLCRLGSIRSFTGSGVDAIGDFADTSSQPASEHRRWALSSASTLGRFESDEDYRGAEFQRLSASLAPTVQRAHAAARAWISARRLDAVCVFNGRIDATRAVLEAAREAGIQVVSMERTWFSHGIQLLPGENCLGLKSYHAFVSAWRDRPLTREQALLAATYAAARFLRTNRMEWRAYNAQANTLAWPVSGSRYKVLLAPGSRNEVWGHPDWESAWAEATAGFDAVMAQFGLSASDVVLRCHPNWSERIGKTSGQLPERYYTDWARSRGVHVIASDDPISTLGLIEACDAVLVTNGSAALDAGVLGKQVVATAPAAYQYAGLDSDARSPAVLEHLVFRTLLDESTQSRIARQTARMTLRFYYTMNHRIAQYVPFVRARSTTSYRYAPGADPGRFIELLRTGQLAADDDEYATDSSGEDDVLNMIQERRWQDILDSAPTIDLTDFPSLKRRWMFGPVDAVRNMMPVGDR